MSKPKKFKDISAPIDADPARRERVKKLVDASEFVLKAEVSEDTLTTGDQVLYCIRSDETGLVWRPAQVISTSNGVSLCVTLIPREACAAGARVTKREQWTLHGYVYDAKEGVGVGQYRKL